MLRYLYLTAAIGLPTLKIMEIGMPARWSWWAVTAPIWGIFALMGVLKALGYFITVWEARGLRKADPSLSLWAAIRKVQARDEARATIEAYAKATGLRR